MYKNENQDSDTICPSCQIGRIQQTQRPYLELHQGHLFTIPHAAYYVCDVCDFAEFDVAAVALISNIIFEASTGISFAGDDAIPQPPSKPDDDLPKKPLQTPASS